MKKVRYVFAVLVIFGFMLSSCTTSPDITLVEDTQAEESVLPTEDTTAQKSFVTSSDRVLARGNGAISSAEIVNAVCQGIPSGPDKVSSLGRSSAGPDRVFSCQSR